jgi:hypothetical protein
MIKKLNPKHLERLLNNKCDVVIYQEGLSEDGEPLTSLNLKNQKCRFVEKTKVVINENGRKIELVGKVILLGDITEIRERKYIVKEIDQMSVRNVNNLPVKLKTPKIDGKKIVGGKVIINDTEYEIFQASKPRNPDGTVHHTTLELM